MTEEIKQPEMGEQNQEGEKPAEQQEQFDPARAMALIEKLRRENRELSKVAKRASDLEAEETKRKEAEMTELQKAQKRLSDLEAELNNERRARMVQAVAIKHSLPDVLVDRLRGETLEELEADAKVLAETLLKPAAQPKPGPGIIPANPGPNGSGETREQKLKRLGLA